MALTIPIDVLRSIIDYDPITGDLRWKTRPARTNIKPGTLIRGSCSDGYYDFSYKGRLFLAHRAAWAHYYGKWPDNVIDHIDRCITNNAIANLRDVSHKTNSRNRSLKSKHSHSRKSSSGFKSVYVTPGGKIWSTMNINGVRTYLGSFASLEDAAKAYNDKLKELENAESR